MMDHETFTEIYERYAALIMKSVVTQTNDKELAEDICQQTFLLMYRSVETIDMDYAKSWLLRTARHLLIDHWRKASTRNEYLEEQTGEEVFEAIADPVDVAKQSMDKLFTSKLLEELREENELWYEAVDHICIRLESYETAAKLLGTTPAALRKRMSRARAFVKNKYGKDYLEDA